MATLTKIQSSLVIPEDQQITINRPSLGPAFVISAALTEGTAYDHTDALLDAIRGELAGLTGEAWTLFVDPDTGRAHWKVDAGGTFDLAFGAFTWIRDWLGWTGDLVGVIGESTAPNEHDGGLYLQRRVLQGNIPLHGAAAELTTGGVTIGGKADLVAATTSVILRRSLILQLTRNSTDWWEFRRFIDLIGQIGDGRLFWRWDSPDDSSPHEGFAFQGPAEIAFQREQEKFFALFRVVLEATEVG